LISLTVTPNSIIFKGWPENSSIPYAGDFEIDGPWAESLFDESQLTLSKNILDQYLSKGASQVKMVEEGRKEKNHLGRMHFLLIGEDSKKMPIAVTIPIDSNSEDEKVKTNKRFRCACTKVIR